MDTFEQATQYAMQIEKNAMEHQIYSGKIEVVKAIDFYPPEMEKTAFEDLINHYEKIQKVIKASQMQIYGKAEPAKTQREVEVKREEAESKVKELTTKAVEDLEKELAAPVTTPPPAPPLPLEFEKQAEEFSSLQPPAPELTFEKPVEKTGEKAPPAGIPSLEREKIAPPPAPPPLQADAAAEQKYREIEEHLERSGDMNEEMVKKKMLELTKLLFKEQGMTQRERIKNEIAVLKNMLAQEETKGPARAATAKGFSSPLAETLRTTQDQELVLLKDVLANYYKRHVDAGRKKFYDQLATLPEEDMEGKKKLYEKLVFELTQLMEVSAQQIQERVRFTSQKHRSELERLQEGVSDARARQQIVEKAAQIEAQYTREFAAFENTLKKHIENLMEKVGREVLRPGEKESEDASIPIIYEVNQTDEGTLLYYLHSKKPDVYRSYERKHLSKHEALFYARVLMAREKGVTDELVRKHMGSLEREENA